MSKKLKTTLQQLRLLAPNRSRHRQLYRAQSELLGRWKKIRFYTLYVSDEETHMIRPHIFKKDRAMTAQEWDAWLAGHLDDIQEHFILPALAVRTDLSKQWAVFQYIGWRPDAKSKARNSATRLQRNQAKSSRRKNG